MKKQVHLLNGDALLHQMEGIIYGDKVVCRECLVEGNLDGTTLDAFFENRAAYILDTYRAPLPDYHSKTRLELEKLKSVSEQAEINLWFEDDLFCQCNFWFVCHILLTWQLNNKVYLVRPAKHHEYSFGSMPREELVVSLKNRKEIELTNLESLQKLWQAYQANNTPEMIALAQQLHTDFPFIGPAVYAHISNRLGIPQKSLKQVMDELQTRKFPPVFQEFCKREAIYGFGDLQVKRMFDKITEKENA